MEEVRETYLSLGKLCRIPVAQLTNIRSVFPILEAVLSERLKVVPEDVPCFPSGAAVACLMGRCSDPAVSLIESAVTAICLRGAFRVLKGMLEVGHFEPDRKMIGKLFGTFAVVLEHSGHLVQDNFAELREKLNVVKGDMSQGNVMVKGVELAERGLNDLLGRFTPRMSLGEVVPKFRAFLLDLQALGLFDMASDHMDMFKDRESFALEALRSVLTKNVDECKSLMNQVIEDLAATDSKVSEKEPFGNMRRSIAKAALASAKEVLQALGSVPLVGSEAKFVVSRDHALPIEYVMHLLQAFGTTLPNRDVMEQVGIGIHSTNPNRLITYLCSGLGYTPELIGGYAAIIASLVSFQEKGDYLDQLLPKLQAYFQNQFLGLVQYIGAANVELPEELKNLMESLKGRNAMTLKEILQAVAVLESVGLYVPDAQKEEYQVKLRNVEKIAIGQVFATAGKLRARAGEMTRMSVAAIEANTIFDERSMAKIVEAFDVVNQFRAGRARLQDFRDLIKAVEKITSSLLPKVEQLITEAPLSLETNGPVNLVELLKLAEVTRKTFDELQDALMPMQDIPAPIVRSTAIMLIQSLYSSADGCKVNVPQQPDWAPSLLSELRLDAFKFALLFRLVSLPDTKDIQDLITEDLYEIDTNALVERMVNVEARLAELNNAVSTPALDDSELINLNIRNRPEVESVLRRVQLPCMKDYTFSLIHSCLSDPRNRQDIQAVEANLKTVVIHRARDVYTLDISQIAQMSEQEAFERSLEIAAVLPYYAGEEQAKVCELSQPLIARRSSAEVYSALRKIITLLMYAAPLRQRVVDISNIILQSGQSAEPEIQDTASIFSIQNLITSAPTQREREFYNLMLFLAHAYARRWTEFTEEAVMGWLKILLQRSKISVNKVVDTINEVVSSFIMTATAYGCYNPEYMGKVRRLLESLEDYKESQSEDNYRRLLGDVCQLPVTFFAYGYMTLDWAIACALVDPTPANQLVTIDAKSLTDHVKRAFPENPVQHVIVERKIIMPQEEKMESASSSSSSSSSEDEDEAPVAKPPPIYRDVAPPPKREYSDSFSYSYSEDEEDHRTVESGSSSDESDSESSDEDMAPQVIYEDVIEEEEVGEPEIIEQFEHVTVEEEEEEDEAMAVVADTAEIRMSRAIDYARQASRRIKELRDAALSLEPQIITSRYEHFYMTVIELKKLITEDQASGIDPRLQAVFDVVSKAIQGDRSEVESLNEPVEFFKKLKQQIRDLSTKSEVFTEMELMAADVQTILDKIEKDPSEAELGLAIPLKRQIVWESRAILENMRLLCKAIDKLLESQPSVPHEKSLVKAIASTSESLQLFYLLTRMFEYEDPALKSKTSVACRRMQSDLTNMLMMMPGKNTQEEVEMKKASAEVFSHLASLLDFTTVAGGAPKPGAEGPGASLSGAEYSVQLSLKRLNAEAQVYKCRDALEQAETEQNRLAQIE